MRTSPASGCACSASRHLIGARRGLGPIAPAHQELHHAGVRRVVEDAAEAHLLLGERGVVVRQRGADGVVLGKVGLDDDASRTFAAAGAARELRQHRVGALDRAEVGKAEVAVGGEHRGQPDAGEVMALGHHLRADQDPRASVGEALEHRGGAADPAGGVAIENVDGDVRGTLRRRAPPPARCRRRSARRPPRRSGDSVVGTGRAEPQ